MIFELSEHHLLVRQQARSIAENELGPIAKQIDEEQVFPMDVYRKAGQIGLIGAAVSTEYGGGGADILSLIIIKEELCRVASGFGISFMICALNFCHFLSMLGTEEQKKKYLPPVMSGDKLASFCLTEPEAGSDALSLRTTARPEGDYYVINGSKTFITNGPVADYFLVVARTKEGKSSKVGTNFLVESGTPGLSVGKKMDKLGMRCSPTSEVFFESVKVHRDQILGTEGSGFIDMFRILDAERTGQACTSLGIAQAAYEAAVNYARERKQFEQPIANFQMIQEKLANMCIGMETARLYTYRTAQLIDEGNKATKESAIAAHYAGSVAFQIAADAVQIHGGYGFIKDYHVERYFRDVKLGEIGGGTSQIKSLVIARELLKEWAV